MQRAQLKQFTWVFLAQCFLITVTYVTERLQISWVPVAFIICAYALPLAGYSLRLYGTPLFQRESTVTKMVLVAIVSCGLTIVGSFLCLALLAGGSMILGFSGRR